jgi:hypothetical protein
MLQRKHSDSKERSLPCAYAELQCRKNHINIFPTLTDTLYLLLVLHCITANINHKSRLRECIFRINEDACSVRRGNRERAEDWDRQRRRIMRSVVVETWERNNFAFNKYIHHSTICFFIQLAPWSHTINNTIKDA